MAEPRIITRLFGGAGNQLFQYAAGRALADRLGCDLVLDTRYVAGSRDRGDCFDHFANARLTRAQDLPPAKSDGMLRYVLWRALDRNTPIYREHGKGFDGKLMEQPIGTYLHGYWQSERYFASIADTLRADLAFTTPFDGRNAAVAEDIRQAGCAISFHVRRGDYISAGAYAACTPDYYRNAAARMASKFGAITCFVFSNDPTWARDNLDLGHDTQIVDINDEATGHFDLQLQTLCDHHVIANSTFSWWAAWLNPGPAKHVIAPAAWFSEGEPDNPDLIPAEWERL